MWTAAQLDLRIALRGFARAKAFTLTAVLTLAVGIAGTAAMFAIVNGVLLRPLPVRDPDRLIVAWKELRSSGFAHYPFEATEIDVLNRESRLLEAVAGVDYNGARPALTIENGTASYLTTVPVTGRFFEVLGVGALLGRALNDSDDVPGAENVLVISDGLWRRRYGAAPDAIGRRLTLRERPFTIVGVMPPGVEFPRGVEVWMTIAAQTSLVSHERFEPSVDLVGRIRKGTSLRQASDELAALFARLQADAPPDAPRGLTPVVKSYTDALVGDVRPGMLALFAAVGLVLLTAGANVANLLLMRGEDRRTELAVRAALGAGRLRLIRQLAAEGVLLGCAAILIAVPLTAIMLQAAIALAPAGLPRADAVRVDASVIAFTAVIAILVAILAGMAPALTFVRRDLQSQLRSGRAASARAATLGRRALVIGQVALAVTVVATAGLLGRSFLRLQNSDTGMDDHLVFAELALPQSRYANPAQQLQFADQLIGNVEAASGIPGATLVNVPPFSGTGGWDAPRFVAEGQSDEVAAANPSLNLESVHANYFETFGVGVLRGRAFTRGDGENAPPVVIVSENVASRVWPGEDPLGKRLKLGNLKSTEPWRTVVGVARATRYRDLMTERATLYLPARQFVVTTRFLVVRTDSPVSAVTPLVRASVREVDPGVRVMRIAAFSDLLEQPLARPRFNALLTMAFGAAALALAFLGVYSVIGAHVRQRYREVGVRLALGASRGDVRGGIVADGLRLAGVGATIGLAMTVAAARGIRGLLFSIGPLDAVTLSASVLLLMGASALAAFLPARRAARLDPAAILRAD